MNNSDILLPHRQIFLWFFVVLQVKICLELGCWDYDVHESLHHSPIVDIKKRKYSWTSLIWTSINEIVNWMPDLCCHAPFSCGHMTLSDHYLFVSYAIGTLEDTKGRQFFWFANTQASKDCKGGLQQGEPECKSILLMLFWLSKLFSYLNNLRCQLAWISDILL